jgi:hypothetical protein
MRLELSLAELDLIREGLRLAKKDLDTRIKALNRLPAFTPMRLAPLREKHRRIIALRESLEGLEEEED